MDCGMQYVGQTCRFLKTRFFGVLSSNKKSLPKLTIFYIDISNKLITLLAVFLSSLLKRLFMMIIPLKDIEIVFSMN